MFGFSARLPITEEQRLWVDDGFRRLERLLGRNRMLNARVIEPTAEDFPEPYSKTPEAAEKLFARVCDYVQVDRRSIEFEIFVDETEELREIIPSWRDDGGTRAAGMYLHGHGQDRTAETGRIILAIRSSMMKDPLGLVATLAHELGHVILLGGNLLDRDDPDHEPLTDLVTVFLGMGIFTANSAARFRQFQDDRRIGWSTQRLGYLPERVFGYALAKFSLERGERKPGWSRHLSRNVCSDFKDARKWLEQNPQYVPVPKPLG
jgi:hypothetical protein